MKNPNDVEIEIYLDSEKKKLPVPKNMYKIITTKNDKNEDVHEVFVFSNDPFKSADVLKNEAVELFGNDFIELKDNFVDPLFGYTFQVNYERFKSEINTDDIKSDLVEHKITFAHGDMVIQQHKTDLGTVQAEFTIPCTKDLKKGNNYRFMAFEQLYLHQNWM